MPHAARLAQAYDRVAHTWPERMLALGYLAAYRGFVAAAGPVQAENVLDAGCGAGDFAAAWRAERGAGAALTLLDPSPAMLARAAKRLGGPGTYAIRGDLDGLRGLGPQDVILCAHVIEHLADPGAGLAAMGRVLAPGGRILLIVSKPHWCNRLIWLRWRHRSLAPPEVRRMIAAAGLCCRAEHTFATGPPSRTSLGYVATRR